MDGDQPGAERPLDPERNARDAGRHRILTVTADTGVAVSLSMRAGDARDIIVADSADDLDAYGEQDFDAALIVVPKADDGVLAASAIRERFGDLPCLVVARRFTDELRDDPPEGLSFLQRPVSLDAVESELARLVHSAAEDERHVATSDPASEEPVPGESRVEAAPSTAPPAAAPRPPTAPPRPPPTPTTPPPPPTPVEPTPPRAPHTRTPPPAPAQPPTPPAPPDDAVADPAPGAPAGPRSFLDRLRRRPRRAHPAEAPGGVEPDTNQPGLDRDRLVDAVSAAEDVLTLVEQRPAVRHRSTVARSLVAEALAAAPSPAAVLWSPDGTGGFEAVASDGIPSQVLHRGPPWDQPLMRELREERPALIYEPEGRFPDYLGDLPGLRTGGMVLGAALHAHGELHGIVVLSGGRYDEDALEAIRTSAGRHARGLAVAAHLELLRRRPVLDLDEEVRDDEAPDDDPPDAPGREPAPESEPASIEELDQALSALEEMQQILDGRPELNRRRLVAGRLLDRLTDSIAIDVAIVWAPDGRGGFEALAWRGVDASTARARPLDDQPLLRELREERDAILRTPGPEGDAELATLPGVDGDVPVVGAGVHLRDEVHAVVVGAGPSLDETDLRTVREIADDHAPALAFAAYAEFLRRP